MFKYILIISLYVIIVLYSSILLFSNNKLLILLTSLLNEVNINYELLMQDIFWKNNKFVIILL